MRPQQLLLGLVLLVSLGQRTVGQDTTSTANLKPTMDGAVQLVLRDGSMLIGRVLEVSATMVRFSSGVGVNSIPRATIASIRPVDPAAMHDGELWPEDPSRTRLFFAPTGRMLRENEGYFADPYIFFPSVQFGVSDIVTIGGGMSLFPMVSPEDQLYYVTPKVGVYTSPDVNVAVGVLAAGAKGISDESPFGIGYGVATFGGENASVTAGAGFGFARGNTTTVVGMLGGSQRVSRNIALVSENYFVTQLGSTVLYSGGLRFMSEKIAVDLALFGTNESRTPLIPYVSFIYRW